MKSHSIWVQRVFLLLLCLAVLYLGLLNLDIGIPGIPPVTLHLTIIIFGELFLLSWCMGILLEQRIKLQRLDSVIFIFLLANLFLLRPFIQYVTSYSSTEADAINRIQPYIQPAYNLLVAVCLVFAVFSFRQITTFHNDLIKTIQSKRQAELNLEGRREADFLKSYPRIAGLPLFGRLARFWAGEGWWVLFFIFGVVILGASLRLWNLDALVPYADEYRHLNAAKSLISGEPFSQLDYRRSLYTVTLPVLVSFRIFGMSLWSARFAGVLAHLLAVIPLYLLMRRIGKGVAILAVCLYLVDPWLILSSRLVREYAYYPLFFFTILLVMVKLVEAVPDDLVFFRDARKLIAPRILLFAGILLLGLIYAYRIDDLSTFRTISVIFPVLFVVVLMKMDWRQPVNRLLGILALGAAAIIIGAMILSARDPGSLLTGKFIRFYFNLFYESPIQQVYYQRGPISLVVLLAAVVGTGFLVKGQKTGAVLLLVYLFALIAFATLSLKDNRPRYGTSIQFWHVSVMAIGLYVAILILQKYFNKLIPWGLGAAFLLLIFWNIPHTLSPVMHTKSGFAPISDDFHPDLAPAYQYLQSYANPDEALVTPETFMMYLEWVDGLKSNPVIEYVYDARNPEKIIYKAIDSYSQGWVVLDYRTGYQWTRPLPFEDFEYNGKLVQFLGWYGDQYIFKWSEKISTSW